MKKENIKKIIVAIFCFIILVGIIYAMNLDKVESNVQVPVLLYHHFLNDDEKKEYEPDKNYSVSLSVFEKQMKYLHDNGYTSLTPEQMICWKKYKCEIPEKSFMITIDDGQKSVLEYAEPILKKYGFNATSFIISSRIKEEKEDFNPAIYQYLTTSEINNTDTIYFGSHTHDMHRMVGEKKRVQTMSYQEMYDDVSMSNKILSTEYIAYPYNTYNNDFISAVKDAGYKLGFRGQSRKTIQSEDSLMISRIFVSDDMDYFYEIFETDKYNQKVGD